MLLTLALTVLLGTSQAAEPSQRIRIDRSPKVPLPDWKSAVALLQRIFVEQQIPVVISVPGKGIPDAGVRTLVIEVVDSDQRRKPVRDSLGFAEVAGERTKSARVFYRAANRLACNCHLEPSTVLAYAIAHEAGHLLTRSCEHDSGIMRENWTVIDAARMRERSLLFSSAYAAKLRRSIAALSPDRAIAP